MLTSPRLSNHALAELCHRLGVESDAGIEIRRTWQREAESAHWRAQPYLAEVRDGVKSGKSLTASLAHAGRVFPSLFLEMVRVGEESGTLTQVFHRLSKHYRRQSQLERAFLAGIAWPVLQLVAAIVVIGILIWVLGIVAARNHGEAIDPLGFGLIGNRGLAIYATFVLVVAGCVAAVVAGVRSGKFWTRPIQHALIRLPVIGPCVEKLALARIAWVLHDTLNVAMDLRHMVPLALRATGNDYYTRHVDSIVAQVGAGETLWASFSRSGAFPRDFIEALMVAEESGRIVESMERLSKRYEEEADSALKTLAVVAGFVVWLFVAALITFLIFRLAGFYFGTINDLLKDT